MASGEKSKMANLKICIDNDASESDDDNLSLTDETNIVIEDDVSDKRIANPVDDENMVADSPLFDHASEKDEVQFNVYLNKLEPRETENPFARVSNSIYALVKALLVAWSNYWVLKCSYVSVCKLQLRSNVMIII